MEWVEVTAKSIEEAKEAALDQLGVDENEAEFQVLDEPKGGLFGRLRSEARVRARVAPTAPRSKAERGDRRRPRRRSGSDTGNRQDRAEPAPVPGGSSEAPEPQAADVEAPSRPSGGPRRRRETNPNKGEPMSDDEAANVGDAAESFLSGLLDTLGATYTVERRRPDPETVEVAVAGDDLGVLIGERGRTLASIQELTRSVVQRQVPGHNGRVVVDISGYREARRQALSKFASDIAAQVVESGVPRVFEPMPPADRKVIHDTVNEIPGVNTTSEGEEPRRRVVIVPAEAGDQD